MPTSASPLARFMSSLSIRLQFITILLSLVGVGFGIRDYIDIREQFGDEKTTAFFNDLLIQTGVAFLCNVLAAYIIYKIATKPIRVTGEVMRALTEGRTDIDVPYTRQSTEIGSMARKVAIFKQNALDKRALEEQQAAQALQVEKEKREMTELLAKDLETKVLAAVEIVASAAGDMQVNAHNLTDIADKTSVQSATVASATEQTSISVQTVASAVEQLSRSIEEINERVAQSTKVNNEAVSEVRRADATISTLSQAAEQIGDVVKLIQNIAAQTNLLALNATIEAARAGEAGKGFAVVASEVKTLANQTAKATEEIAQRISQVQNVSTESVTAIRGIGKIIEQTSEIATGISKSIQQQTEAAREISLNVQQASRGTEKIAASIMAVTKDAADSHVAAEEVSSDSRKLHQQCELLQTGIQSFLTKVRQS